MHWTIQIRDLDEPIFLIKAWQTCMDEMYLIKETNLMIDDVDAPIEDINDIIDAELSDAIYNG